MYILTVLICVAKSSFIFDIDKSLYIRYNILIKTADRQPAPVCPGESKLINYKDNRLTFARARAVIFLPEITNEGSNSA